jgi:hypothetical protein
MIRIYSLKNSFGIKILNILNQCNKICTSETVIILVIILVKLITYLKLQVATSIILKKLKTSLRLN